MKMSLDRRTVLALLSMAAVPRFALAQKSSGEAFRTITWDELMPKGWDPVKQFRERNPGSVAEGSPREQLLMNDMREMWDQAPTRAELDGARVRLPGFVVPLEGDQGKVTEFLLVPYFGACIHSPPPPANQIIHVVLPGPQPLKTMSPIWASGVLRTQRQDSPWGISGYRMSGHATEPYTPKS